MSRAPDADRRVFFPEIGFKVWAPGQNKGDRARPVALHQAPGGLRDGGAEGQGLGLRADEDGQLHAPWPPLQPEEAVRCPGMEGVRRQPVDRIGRHPDYVPTGESLYREGDGFRRRPVAVSGDDCCRHQRGSLASCSFTWPASSMDGPLRGPGLGR